MYIKSNTQLDCPSSDRDIAVLRLHIPLTTVPLNPQNNISPNDVSPNNVSPNNISLTTFSNNLTYPTFRGNVVRGNVVRGIGIAPILHILPAKVIFVRKR
jgi:hypothetical protein